MVVMKVHRLVDQVVVWMVMREYLRMARLWIRCLGYWKVKMNEYRIDWMKVKLLEGYMDLMKAYLGFERGILLDLLWDMKLEKLMDY